MAVRQVVVSDISGIELTKENHARVIVEHPDISGALELDISTDEAAKLTDTTLRLVGMTVFAPGESARSVRIETKVLDKLFVDVDFDRVLEGARRADLSKVAPSQRPSRGSAGPRPERIDYTASNHFGQLHRGRVTEAEAALVRGDRDQASANRQAQGHGSIDWNDPAERKRYGL